MTSDPSDEEDTSNMNWKSQLLIQLKKFDSGKFESFSRLLIAKMGVSIDKHRGIVRSGDHGIDGFGYFTSDEFRTWSPVNKIDNLNRDFFVLCHD